MNNKVASIVALKLLIAKRKRYGNLGNPFETNAYVIIIIIAGPLFHHVIIIWRKDDMKVEAVDGQSIIASWLEP